jgi:hypothetical protein
MSVFDKNIIEGSRHTAAEFAGFDRDDFEGRLPRPTKFGRIDIAYQWANPIFQLEKITNEDIDEVIDNLLTYIYYHVKLGFNHTGRLKYEINVPACLFGITERNRGAGSVSDRILEYVFDQLRKRGFETFYLMNDNAINISWKSAK